MELWHAWLANATDEVGGSVAEIPIDALLDLAAAVANDVARPMAPVSAFVAGLAAGRGADAEAVASALTRLAKAWPEKGTGRNLPSSR
ncbi:hypothetical protein RPIT_10845 [Tessaracoccus flavus]|uniref:DUF6457 domain-containing protein n=1 Tax=Tessaracoccus flavus TaxID=1610493 RepID=A0A1Q2CJA2_9ACTN|nr:hypothetical protein RPIT_10845 [Tessaracoccus flavus]